MADVASSVRERGQLILIGGLSLAVVFVALALVLNSAIYTENLATRTSDNPADTAVQFRHDALSGAGTVVDHANRNGGDRTYSDRYAEYQNTVDEWQEIHADYSAINGLFTDIRAMDGDGTEGTRVVDDNHGSDYTSREGQTDWTVADDVQVRQFRLSVARDNLLPSLDDSDVETTLVNSGSLAFYVEFDDGVNPQRVAVYKDLNTGEVKVMRYDSSSGTTSTCIAKGSPVRVDITGGTLDGTHCEALSFVGELSGTYDISYSNANLIQGTYDLTVDRVEGPFRNEVDAENGGVCSDPTYYDDPAAGAPYTTPAIYSTSVDLVYDGPSVTYETESRVAPGEPGGGAVAPTVTQFDISDASGTDASFGISWSASDPNGNLDTVAVTVTNDDTGSTTTYNGASGSETFSESNAGNDEYTIEIVATDSDGHSRSVSETHIADGDGEGCPP